MAYIVDVNIALHSFNCLARIEMHLNMYSSSFLLYSKIDLQFNFNLIEVLQFPCIILSFINMFRSEPDLLRCRHLSNISCNTSRFGRSWFLTFNCIGCRTGIVDPVPCGQRSLVVLFAKMLHDTFIYFQHK